MKIHKYDLWAVQPQEDSIVTTQDDMKPCFFFFSEKAKTRLTLPVVGEASWLAQTRRSQKLFIPQVLLHWSRVFFEESLEFLDATIYFPEQFSGNDLTKALKLNHQANTIWLKVYMIIEHHHRPVCRTWYTLWDLR